ncbi:MAG: alpha-glucosidase, partial [Myxococcota bacterium]
MKWWQTGCVYQVYLRSFQDSDGDGVGDLPGLRRRLPELVELGVSALWLSPIHDSPDVDFGYDVADYRSIHPRLGTTADLRGLIDDAHAAGLKIILDGVFNHTSSTHPWFTDSRQRKNDRDDWYIWRDTPNNWQSIFGGPAWTFCPQRGQHYLHSFASQQPDLNWRCPEVAEAILAEMTHWLDQGVDGFRLDVFNCYRKSADLTDNPRRYHAAGLVYGYLRQHHIHDRDQDDLAEILAILRALIDRYDDRFLVGEPLDERLQYEQAARWVGPDHLHTAFSFRLLHTKWKARAFRNAINAW